MCPTTADTTHAPHAQGLAQPYAHAHPYPLPHEVNRDMTRTPAAQLEQFGWTAVPSDESLLIKDMLHGQVRQLAAADIPVPETPLAVAVRNYVKERLPSQTFNHSMRVYLYGKAIIMQHFQDWRLDDETLFITAMLHDIGTTPLALRSTLLSFEYWGGMHSLTLLQGLHAPLAQAESVAEVIIRHQDMVKTGSSSQLHAVIKFATLFDNVGHYPHLIHQATIQSVTQAWPRNGWTGCFAATIREEIRLKPWAHTSTVPRFAESVEANSLMEPYDK